MPYLATRFTGTALPERRPLGTDVTISPCTGDARSVLPSSTVGPSWPTFPSYLKMLRNPPTTAAFVVPAAATAACCRCCCCFCATCRHCYFAFVVRNKSFSLRFVASVVSLRCLCLCLVACLDHSWVSRSLESDLVYVRRVLAILSVSPVFGLRLCRAC